MGFKRLYYGPMRDFRHTLAPLLTNLKAHPMLAMRPGHGERRKEIPTVIASISSPICST
jgi:hypothetical protein